VSATGGRRGDLDGADLVGVVAPTWSENHTAVSLGLSVEQLEVRRAEGTLLGVPDSEGVRHYPVSQFERDARGLVRVKPALREWMRVLRERDPWTVAILLVTPGPELDGMTPAAFVRANGEATSTLIEHARIVNAEVAGP
jgi:hypothetical protein